MNQGSGLPHFTLLEQIASFKSEAECEIHFLQSSISKTGNTALPIFFFHYSLMLQSRMTLPFSKMDPLVVFCYDNS